MLNIANNIKKVLVSIFPVVNSPILIKATQTVIININVKVKFFLLI